MHLENKVYDQDTDSLFLLYTAIDESLNKNGWRVRADSIDSNITSGLNKPLVFKKKDELNAQDARQKGNYIHPHSPIAGDYQDQLRYQETYALGRAVKLDKDGKGKWRVWFNVTDPKAKTFFKEASSIDQQRLLEYPEHISPLIATFPAQFPDEEAISTFNHWAITHWALVDEPAYSDLLKLRGRCNGTLAECEIKLKNASSSEQPGFCVAAELSRFFSAAATAKTDSNSSQGNTPTFSESMQDSPPMQGNSYEKVTGADGKPLTITNQHHPTSTTSSRSAVTPPEEISRTEISKTEPVPNSQEKPGQEKGETRGKSPPPNQEEEKEVSALLENASPQLKSYIDTLRNEAVSKESAYRTVLQEIAELKNRFQALDVENRRNKLKTIIPRYNFKTDEAQEKEIDKVMNWSGISDEEIGQIYNNQLIVSQTKVSPKAGSTTNSRRTNYNVPDFSNTEQREGSVIASSDKLNRLMGLVTMLDNNNGSSGNNQGGEF